MLLLWASMEVHYACTVKPNDILKAKNASLQFVSCVTQRTTPSVNMHTAVNDHGPTPSPNLL